VSLYTMNLKQIRDDVLARVGTDHEITSLQIDRFINEGKTKIEAAILDKVVNFFPSTENLTFTANDISKPLTLSWTNISIIQADDGLGNGYKTLTKAKLDRVLDTNNQSDEYCLWGTTLYLTKKDVARSVRIFGYITPVELVNNNDIPQFDALLHPLMVTWAHGCMLEAIDESYSNGGIKKNEFYKDLENILPVVVGYDSTTVTSLI